MKTKNEKALSKWKTEKSMKSVRSMGKGHMVEKIFGKICFSLEWQSEGATDDESGDSEEDEGDEDWFGQGWRSETGSLFQRWGDDVGINDLWFSMRS